MTLEDNDTIVAIATAYGVGSISIVRISGSKALSISQKITKDSSFLPKPRYAHLRKIYNLEKEFLDEAIVIYFKAPFSFTGEDIVEIQCHGGIMMSKIILDACIQAGARMAQAGEFSKKAFLNGKMDLSKIESVSSIISAKSEYMVKLISNNLKGDLKDFVDKTRESLIKILAYSEVSIDYAEEDLPPILILDMQEKLLSIKNELYKIQKSSEQRLTLLDGYKVTLIGKPNVGKSSLLNELLSFNRAIVSDKAGTTTDTIEDNIIISSKLVKIIDTAGIRESSDAIESIGIEKTIASIEKADIVIALFDISRELDSDDEQIISLLNKYNKKKIIVFTKTDLKSQINTDKIKCDVKISCKNKDISSLMTILEDTLIHEDSYDDTILTSRRQIDIVNNTISHIQKSYTLLKEEELELFSYHIKESIEEISNITKTFEYSELLDEIFGNFCLGK